MFDLKIGHSDQKVKFIALDQGGWIACVQQDPWRETSDSKRDNSAHIWAMKVTTIRNNLRKVHT